MEPVRPQAAEPVPPEPPSRRWWLTKRFVIAAVGVVLLSGGATAVLAFNEVGKIVEALGQRKAVKIAPNVLASAPTGAPETLLLVGNDQRPPPKNNPIGFVLPHSNEMLLVRIDPGAPTISMLSIPRELQVPIHTRTGATVVTRINAALAFGGIELMTKTIEQVLGLPINHVFVVTFPRFKQAVNEMGCVYMTVDRRYYHRNEPGGEQYFEVNLEPGYQRLCGPQALEFVAFRHQDTSLVRDARDQRFLLEVKAQYGPGLFEDRERFEHIFGKAVETDLHGSGQVLDLLRLLVAAAGKPVRQVHFQVNLGPTVDTASPQQISESVSSFLAGTSKISSRDVSRAAHAAAHSHHTHGAPAPGLAPTTAEELDQARSQAPSLPFALEYPRAQATFAGSPPDELRTYAVRDPSGRIHRAYTIVIDQGPLGEFYDVQGTSWANPPLLANPNQEIKIGHRIYALFYAGEQIRTVAWHEGKGVYWVENTLTNSLSPRTMIDIAQETTPVITVTGAPAPSTPLPPAAQAFKVPAKAVATASLPEEIGAGLGLAGILAVAAMSILVFSRQREVRRLREQVAHALGLEARQRPLLAAAGIAVPAPAPVAQAPPPRPASPPRPAAATRPAAAVPIPAPGPVAARPGPAGRTVYRAPRRWRVGPALAVVAVLLAAGGAAFALTRSSAPSGPSGEAPSTKSVAHGRQLPVSVYNATQAAGSAHRIAGTLAGDHVRISTVGNIGTTSTLGPGTFVLFPPHAQAQAQRVAALIPGGHVTVAPISSQVQAAIGHHHEIVVVLD
jgi:LCP family protein required for cell wall assembly